MKEGARNIAVGLTVVVALGLLGGLVVFFAGTGPWATKGYDLELRFEATGNAQVGDPVHLRGMPVGTIRDIRFTEGDARKGVTLVARIEEDVAIPANVQAVILSKGITGAALIDLQPAQTAADPKAGGPAEVAMLPRENPPPIQGVIRTGIQLPADLKASLDDLKGALAAAKAGLTGIAKVADSLNDLIGSKEHALPEPGEPATLISALQRVDRILAGMEQTFGKVQTEKGFDAIIANLAEASERSITAIEALEAFAKEARATAAGAGRTFQAATATIEGAGKNVDKVAEQMAASARELSRLLATFNKVAMKIDSGKGTAGKLLNDPKLYNNLLDSTRQMTLLLKDFRDLIEFWKKRGVGVKLK
jgi:phospholipid/cholesterol/gamma-HCH transport system substrate-binding protein